MKRLKNKGTGLRAFANPDKYEKERIKYRKRQRSRERSEEDDYKQRRRKRWRHDKFRYSDDD